MGARKSFLLRIDPRLYESLQRWAADDVRSLNGQIEYLLREALGRAGRLPRTRPTPDGAGSPGESESPAPSEPSASSGGESPPES